MIERAFRAALADIRLNLLSIFSVAVAFVCLAATLLVVVNVDAVRERYAHTGHASVYLKPKIDLETVREVEKALRQVPGVTKVRYVSNEDARHEVLARASDEALEALPSEAFPASLEVSLAHPEAGAKTDKLKAELEKLPAVEAVETYRSFSDRLAKLLAGGVAAAGLLTLVVLGAVISVVSSTMGMALSRRRTEVEVLKMVGATDEYVRGPFVVEGAFQGGVGAFFAVLLLGVLYLILKDAFADALGSMLGIVPRFLPVLFVGCLVLLGAMLGAATAFFSMRRFSWGARV